MDFQNPHNNKNNMKEKTQKDHEQQQQEEDNHQVIFSDDNMCLLEQDNDELKPTNDNEEKKQKRVGNSVKRGNNYNGNSNNNSNGGVFCQAEKCSVDLSEATKRYHKRHKVCEFHAKAPSVLVSGLRQRFCQQCSRFHELSEFDETKRSCRRRLAGHNERRRKNSSEPQGEGGSSSRSKPTTPNPQCRPADHGATRVQMTSNSAYPASTPAYKHFQIR